MVKGEEKGEKFAGCIPFPNKYKIEMIRQHFPWKIEMYLGATFSVFMEAIRPFGAEDN